MTANSMRTLLLLCLLATGMTACKKRPSTVTPASVRPAAPPNPAKDLPELTEAVRGYSMSQGKAPNTLEDLVKARCIERLPAPPPGKKYAIDGAKLEAVLVNQ